jgi:hypothetical protein
LRERKGKEWQIDAKICTSGALMMAKSRAYCDYQKLSGGGSIG